MSENEEPTLIPKSIYDVEEKSLDLAQKFFDVDDMSTLKVGLFGYITSCFGTFVTDSTLHRDSLYDEFFLNTASRPESVYNKAKDQNKDIGNAVPAKIQVNFALKKEHVIDSRFAERNDNDAGFTFKIDRNNKFLIGDYNYMLDYDVIIQSRKLSEESEDYAITAQYVVDEEENRDHARELDNPYITSWVNRVEGDEYVFLRLDIFQMKREEKEFSVYSEDTMEKLFYEVNYEDQLAFFNVKYNYKGDEIILPKYFNEQFKPEEDEYCYYTFLSDDKFQVYFSAMPNEFRPEFNSTLTVESYTTKGEGGNFKYSGEDLIPFKFNDPNLEDLPVVVSVNANYPESRGGKDRPSLKETKQELISDYLSRDNLISTIDLSNFFNKLIERENINDSEMEFMKKRDDALKRIFSAFLMLRDNNEYIIPTNTINLTTNFEMLEDYNYQLKSGDVLVYNIAEEDYKILPPNEDPESYIESAERKGEEIILYASPYFLDFKLDRNLSTSYYRDFIDNTLNLSYKYMNTQVNYEFIMNEIDVFRNSIFGGDEIGTDQYKIEFQLDSNIDEEDLDNGNLILRMSLKEQNEDEINHLGYFDFSLTDPETNTFSAILQTSNEYIDGKELKLTNTEDENVTDIYTPDGLLAEDLEVTADLDFDFGVIYHKDKAGSTEKFEHFSDMEDLDDYCTAVIFQSEDNISLFNSLNSIIQSDIIVNDQVTIVSINGDPDDGLEYEITLRDETNSYTSSAGDTNEDVALELRDILRNTSLEEEFLFEADGNELVITSPSPPFDFEVNVLNDTDGVASMDTDTNDHLEIRSIPVISQKYFTKVEDFSQIYSLLEKFEEAISGNISKLENNTDIDIKFYNTYGPSKYYWVETEDGTERITTNISIDISVRLHNTLNKGDLDDRLKEFIMDFVETTNDGDSNIISASNLITAMENEFDEIAYIEFNTINGYPVQTVNYDFPDNILNATREQLINYVPEYVNIGGYTTFDSTEDFNPTITINYI